MSNAERQRRFQEAHPGYDARRKARQRGAGKRLVARLKAQWQAAAEAERAVLTAGPLALPAPAAVAAAASRPVLMLPAPAEELVLPGLNASHRTPAAAPAARTPEPQLLLFPALRPAA